MRRILLLSLFIPVFAFTGTAAASGTTLDLVGFSTPQAVVGKLITNWQKTSAGTGVQVVTPDPFPSGGAKWNVLAAYGAQRKMGKTDKQATNYVLKMFHHVVQQDTSASQAMATFLNGKGDVLLTYESEAYTALAAGKDVKIVQPKQTMLIQLPMVPLKDAPTQARTFIKYVHSYGAQRVFTNAGY